MSVSSASSSSSAAATTSSSSSLATSAASVQSQYQTFLTLLTTELQNQDPTQPLDSTQFTSQLAQFSQLEQQLESNSYLSTIAGNQTSGQFTSAIAYIGHTVNADGDSFSLDGSGTTTPLSFSLSSAAQTATIGITNSGGQVVNTVTMSNPTSGNNTYEFNAEDSSGEPLPAGTYTFSVAATSANGATVTATTYESGKVTAVSNNNGTTTLTAGSLTIPASNVVAVTS